MRVVNAMFSRGRGGLQKVFLDYCRVIADAGHEVVALIHPHAAVRPVLERRCVAFHAIGNVNAWDPWAMLRLRLWLRQQAPDAVVAHGNRGISLLAGAGARPLIGVAANYTMKSGRVDAVLCATEDLAAHCRAGGVAGDRISLVPHMVDVPPTPPQRRWRDPPVIGAMGRFVGKKGFGVLIEALPQLAEAGIDFRAVIAGEGEEAATLQALAGRLGVAVRFSGWQDDTAAFFDSIDIFCMPSLHEPFGVVLLEAMAQALPVIAADSEGPSEIIRNGSDGILVPKADPAALAEAIRKLLGDPVGAQAMGLRAYAAVRDNYSPVLLSGRLDAILRGLRG